MLPLDPRTWTTFFRPKLSEERLYYIHLLLSKSPASLQLFPLLPNRSECASSGRLARSFPTPPVLRGHYAESSMTSWLQPLSLLALVDFIPQKFIIPAQSRRLPKAFDDIYSMYDLLMEHTTPTYIAFRAYCPLIISAAFSATAYTKLTIFPWTCVGRIEASITRTLLVP